MNLDFFSLPVFCLSTSLIIWTYAIYPILIRLLKPYHKPIRRDSKYSPTFSVIVPAHNEASVISKKLKNLLSLDYPRDKIEIIVIDDGSTDNTLDLAKKFDGVKILESRRIGKSKAINQGLRKATGDIVLVTDADCFFGKDALIYAAKVLSDESVGAVTGNIELLEYTPSFIRKDFSKIINGLFRYESLLDSVSSGMGSFLAFKRELVDNLNPNCLADDVDISIRVRMRNFRVISEPKIRVQTWDPNTFRTWYSQSVRRTLQGLTTLFQHKSVLFNPKYGWYGMMILPTRLLLHRLAPFLLFFSFLSSLFIDFRLSAVLVGAFFIGCFLIPRMRKFLVIQFVFLNAWILYILRRYRVTWEKGPRKNR